MKACAWWNGLLSLGSFLLLCQLIHYIWLHDVDGIISYTFFSFCSVAAWVGTGLAAIEMKPQ